MRTRWVRARTRLRFWVQGACGHTCRCIVAIFLCDRVTVNSNRHGLAHSLLQQRTSLHFKTHCHSRSRLHYAARPRIFGRTRVLDRPVFGNCPRFAKPVFEKCLCTPKCPHVSWRQHVPSLDMASPGVFFRHPRVFAPRSVFAGNVSSDTHMSSLSSPSNVSADAQVSAQTVLENLSPRPHVSAKCGVVLRAICGCCPKFPN